MKIAIIGYGKMGKRIEKAALEKKHEIVAIIDPNQFGNTISDETLSEADVCIEFTKPSSVLENIRRLVELKKNVVIGTTGWEKYLPEVKELLENNPIGFFAAPNFSLGMNLFIKILQEATKTILPTGLYDVAGIEEHHKQKLDTPSGTAKTISNALSDCLDGTLEVPFTSLRCGSIPGTHTLIFDSPFDTITLTHAARNRDGFAQGAIAAAEWLQGRVGFYSMNDLLFAGDILCTN